MVSSVYMPDTAMILAAGLGTRMQPITENAPKPMTNICGRPIIGHILDNLIASGIKKVVVNTHHHADILESYLKQRMDIPITISHEEELLETGGGLVKALALLGQKPFYVINGDIIWVDNKSMAALPALAKNWDDSQMDAFLLLKECGNAVGYDGSGDFELKENLQLQRTKNKTHSFVFTGIYILHPRLLENLTVSKFSISSILFKNIQEDGTISRIYGLSYSGTWLHIGTVKNIKEAEKKLL